jgi:hypothetical protein
MRNAEAARRSTLRSNALAFYLRIFDDRLWAAYSKDLAQAGVDRPPWQTLEAILPPAAGTWTRA